ncbi:MAG: CRISPR system precrRNA processing endoribonuclease RAMP protein Cas6 [Nitrospira sp.]|nr:CRISPR system precrRNA processing endoribonuclease RAMP protein Cas6 [Nitrospira sp.]
MTDATPPPAGHATGLPLSFGRFTATFRLDGPLSLPPYAGSLFRGSFGWALMRSVCVTRSHDCPPCLLRDRCIYPWVFETPPPAGTTILRKYQTAPHPFVLIPPHGGHTVEAGQTLDLGLTLFGRTVAWLPHFIFALERMGRAGLGGRRTTASLAGVDGWLDSRRHPVYDAKERMLRGVETFTERKTLPHAPSEAGKLALSQRIAIDILSPLRIRYREHLTARLDFHVFIRSLLRRLALLSYFHCGGDPSIVAFREWIALAERVRTVSSSLTWSDWTRYSSRQRTEMELGGVTGTIIFEGPLAPFLPLLRLGEVAHAGKGTSFGLGRYRLRDVDRSS